MVLDMSRHSCHIVSVSAESSKHESVALSLARCARLGEIVLANENLKELSSSGLAHQILKNTGLCYVRRVFERKFHNHSTLPCFNGRHKNITHSYRMNHRKNQRLNTNSIVTGTRLGQRTLAFG